MTLLVPILKRKKIKFQDLDGTLVENFDLALVENSHIL